MAAYLYLFLHNLLGGLIKLFRRAIVWLILLTIMTSVVMGVSFGLVGGIVGVIVMQYQDQQEEEIIDAGGEDSSDGEDAEAPEEEEEEDLIFGLSLTRDLDTIKDLCESLAMTAIIALTLIFIGTGLKKGVSLFSMADINFLFTSPLKPQGNLLYRMAGQMISFLALGLYMGIVMPLSFLGMGLKYYQILSCVLVYVLILFGGHMISILSYMVTSNYDGLKNKVRYGIYGVAVVLAGIYLFLVKHYGLTYIQGLIQMFTPAWTDWLPYVGWLKAIVGAAAYHQYAMIGVFSLLSVAAIIGIAWMTLKFPADFYEDAFEYAEKLQAAQKASETGAVTETIQRTRKRGKLYRRGHIGHGERASVLMFRTLYLRKRLALFGIFSLEMLLWLIVLGGGAYFLQDMKLVVLYGFLVGITIYEMFRNFGNPLAVDLDRPYIYLMPDTPWRKLAFAMLGNLLSFLIDALPGVILMAVIAGFTPVEAIGCVLVTCGLNFFFSGTGLLISILIPESIPAKLKTYIQSMLKLVPMLPVIVVASAAVYFDHPLVGIYGVGLAGLAFGFGCLALSAFAMERMR